MPEAAQPSAGCSVVSVSGFDGERANLINGTYGLVQYPSHPVGGGAQFQRLGNPIVCLFRADGLWWIGNERPSKDSRGKGWAHSRPGHSGLLPPKVGVWSVEQLGGVWKERAVEIVPIPPEEGYGSASMAWAASMAREAEAAAVAATLAGASPAASSSSPATSPNATLTSPITATPGPPCYAYGDSGRDGASTAGGCAGVLAELNTGDFFVLEAPTKEGAAPTLRHRQRPDQVLHYTEEGRWHLEDSSGLLARSEPVLAGVLPLECTSWEVRADGDTTDNGFRFVPGLRLTRQSPPREDVHVGVEGTSEQEIAAQEASQKELEEQRVIAEAWASARVALDGRPWLEVTGFSGPGSLYLNGVYVLQAESDQGPPIFLHRDWPSVCTCRYIASRWWITEPGLELQPPETEPAGWACTSEAAAIGSLPTDVRGAGSWSCRQRDGHWWQQDVTIVSKSEEEVTASAVQHWQGVYADIVARPLLHVSGASGTNAALINGLYKLVPPTIHLGGPPIFEKKGNEGVWLYPSNHRMWWFGSAEDLGTLQPSGWAHSALMKPGLLPDQARGWKISAPDGSWEPQQLTLEFTPSEEALEHAAGSWRRAYSTMRDNWLLEITGAEGELAAINGAYELRPLYLEQGLTVFQHRANPGIWLYPGKDRRWWVSTSQRKDAQDSAGWACSEPVELGTLPNVVEGWNLFTGERSWQGGALSIRAKPLKDADPTGGLAWTTAMGELDGTPNIEISNAGEAIDGLYILQSSRAIGLPPFFRERVARERWLYYSVSHRCWWLADTRREELAESRSWLRSETCDAGVMPQAASGWFAFKDGGWVTLDDITLQLRPHNPCTDETEMLPSLESLKSATMAPANYILDNGYLRSTSSGVRHCRTRNLEDFDERFLAEWGSVVTGVEIDADWIWISSYGGSYLPKKLRGLPILLKEVEADFVVDNSQLQTSTRGMKHRRSRLWDDLHPTDHSIWGTIVRGVDSGDGWVRISASGLFLPTHIKGVPVVVPNTSFNSSTAPCEIGSNHKFLLDNSRLKAMTKGMRHRNNKNLNDFHDTAHSLWGDSVIGLVLPDGWVQLHENGLFLPMEIRGVPVLVPDMSFSQSIASSTITSASLADHKPVEQTPSGEACGACGHFSDGRFCTRCGESKSAVKDGPPLVLDMARSRRAGDEELTCSRCSTKVKKGCYCRSCGMLAEEEEATSGQVLPLEQEVPLQSAPSPMFGYQEIGGQGPPTISVGTLGEGSDKGSGDGVQLNSPVSLVSFVPARSQLGGASSALEAICEDPEIKNATVQVPTEWIFYLDNSQLNANTEGIQHRYSRDMRDCHPLAISLWGSTVQGYDLGDGWVQVSKTGLFLPRIVTHVEVLVPQGPPSNPMPFPDVASSD